MNQHNGSAKSPARAVVRSVADIGHDAITLAELQTQLLRTELRRGLRAAVATAILLAVALAVTAGCVPVLLFSFAYGLVEFAELSHSLSLLIAALVGLLVAAVTAAVGWRRLHDESMTLERTREEFQQNVQWIKQVLSHKADPPGSDGTPGGRKGVRPQ